MGNTESGLQKETPKDSQNETQKDSQNETFKNCVPQTASPDHRLSNAAYNVNSPSTSASSAQKNVERGRNTLNQPTEAVYRHNTLSRPSISRGELQPPDLSPDPDSTPAVVKPLLVPKREKVDPLFSHFNTQTSAVRDRAEQHSIPRDPRQKIQNFTSEEEITHKSIPKSSMLNVPIPEKLHSVIDIKMEPLDKDEVKDDSNSNNWMDPWLKETCNKPQPEATDYILNEPRPESTLDAPNEPRQLSSNEPKTSEDACDSDDSTSTVGLPDSVANNEKPLTVNNTTERVGKASTFYSPTVDFYDDEEETLPQEKKNVFTVVQDFDVDDEDEEKNNNDDDNEDDDEYGYGIEDDEDEDENDNEDDDEDEETAAVDMSPCIESLEDERSGQKRHLTEDANTEPDGHPLPKKSCFQIVRNPGYSEHIPAPSLIVPVTQNETIDNHSCTDDIPAPSSPAPVAQNETIDNESETMTEKDKNKILGKV